MSDMTPEAELNDLIPREEMLSAHDQEPPVLTDGLLRLCCALSAASYDMDIQPWLQTGWCDITLQYEGNLTGVVDPAQQEQGIEKVTAGLKLKAVQTMLANRTPNQLVGTLKELKQSGTGTAMVLAHPMDDGTQLVAIGFTGTGKQLYDWVSNMRMKVEEGAHQGFLQLTRQFERNMERITLPQTAETLGLEQLTLLDVLKECGTPESRFRLVCTGHSQGGAVMQLFILHLLRDMGVLPRYVTGVGFASPCVVVHGAVADPRCWPMVHVVNSQDVVPRVGALCHLGRMLVYDTDDGLRTACYRAPGEGEKETAAQSAAVSLLACMRNTPDSLLVGIALCRQMLEHPQEKVPDTVLQLAQGNTVVRTVLQSAGRELARVLHYTVRRIRMAYEDVMGAAPEAAQEDRVYALVAKAVEGVGLLPLATAMMRLGTDAHSIFRIAPGLSSSYHYIAQLGVQALHAPEDLS